MTLRTHVARPAPVATFGRACHPRRMLRLAVLATLLVAACSKSESTPPAPTPQAAPAASTAPAGKDPAAARTLIASGAIVYDVRTPDEFGQGHLDQAQNLPLDQLSGRLAEVAERTGNDHGKPIVVYCAAGARAAKAKRLLEQAGYTNVVNGGGLDDLR